MRSSSASWPSRAQPSALASTLREAGPPALLGRGLGGALVVGLEQEQGGTGRRLARSSIATKTTRHSTVGHCSPVTVSSPMTLTSISIDVRNVAVELRPQPDDLADAHGALEEQVVDEGRHAGAARVPLRADGARRGRPRP